MTKSRSHDEAKIERFRTDPDYAAEYLNAVLEDGDQEELHETLRQLRQDMGEGLDSGPATPWNPDEVKQEGRKRQAVRSRSGDGE